MNRRSASLRRDPKVVTESGGIHRPGLVRSNWIYFAFNRVPAERPAEEEDVWLRSASEKQCTAGYAGHKRQRATM